MILFKFLDNYSYFSGVQMFRIITVAQPLKVLRALAFNILYSVQKIDGMANIADPDHTAPDLSLHCIRDLNISDHYGLEIDKL